MDAERQHPADPGQHDSGRPPGQRDGLPEHSAARHAEPDYPESRRPRRVGKRSGVELPDDEAGGDDRFHAQMIDRADLRRPEAVPQQPFAAAPEPSDIGASPTVPVDLLSTGLPDVPVGLLGPEAEPTLGAGAPELPAYLAGGDPGMAADLFGPGGLLGPAAGAPVGPASRAVGPESDPGIDAPTMRYAPGHGPTQPLPSAGSIYRPRRPALAALLAVAAGFAEVMVLIEVFVAAAAAHPTNSGGVLAGLFALAGIPMVTMGLYALATGAATAGGPHIGRAWLRTPLAYLPVGLVLLIAAGMAG